MTDLKQAVRSPWFWIVLMVEVILATIASKVIDAALGARLVRDFGIVGIWLFVVASPVALLLGHEWLRGKNLSSEGYIRRGDTVTITDASIEKPADEAVEGISVPRLINELSITEEQRLVRKSGTATELTGKYLGIRCKNRGDTDITNCRIRLEKLEEWNPSWTLWHSRFDPVTLAWSLNDGGGQTQMIGPRANRMCDLVCYEGEETDHALIVTADPSLRSDRSLEFGRWKATCRVEADGYLPVTIEATFIWEARKLIGPVTAARNLEFLGLVVEEAKA